MATDITFLEGYIKDEWSQLIEPIHRSVDGRSFLWTGRKPTVGQRTDTTVTTGHGALEWCRLSGVVTAVGPLPTTPPAPEDERRRRSGDDSTTSAEAEERRESLERFGTVHGQTVTSHAILNLDFHDRREGLPFDKGRVYRLTHEADVGRSFVWCVTKIEDVTDLLKEEELPESFRGWWDGMPVGGIRRKVSF